LDPLEGLVGSKSEFSAPTMMPFSCSATAAVMTP
jgi:hypothetical protein